jgi:ATP-dependent DNA helicase RecQ
MAAFRMAEEGGAGYSQGSALHALKRPVPAMSLAEVVPDPKYQVLKDVFGFDGFRPGQERVVDALLAGRNVLTVMPTGAGKSLCFQVPALVLGGLTVVVSPLIALMQDQVAALRLAGVAADAINSAQDREANVAAWQRAAAGETRLLYLSPERLMTDRMLAALGRLDVRLIAIDEAHCVSQWGPAFRPEYQMLARLSEMFPRTPMVALTATADEATRADIALQLFDDKVETFVLGFDRPNIALTVEAKREWKRQMLAFAARHKGKSGIVYCLSRKRTEEAAITLAEAGFKARMYHAGMDKDAREASQNAFMTEPGIVMAATIAFGMGIDKPDVRFVFHADLPGSLEAYYQEFGRAGRDGKPAEAHMLFGLADIRMRRMFIDEEESDADRKRREHQRLGALLGFCEASTCRRQILLRYFGERGEPCGNCDACTAPVAMIDATYDARLALAAVQATGGRYGAGHIVDVLVGGLTEKVTRARHDALESFNKGHHRKREEWQSLTRQLVAGDYLTVDMQGYGGLSMTPKGRALLAGKGAFDFRPPGKPKRAERIAREAAAIASTDIDPSLLTKLKQLRLSLAKQRGVAAYLIFSDKSLIDMAERRPQNIIEFGEVHGVGAAKQKEFANVFLNAIAEHAT